MPRQSRLSNKLAASSHELVLGKLLVEGELGKVSGMREKAVPHAGRGQ